MVHDCTLVVDEKERKKARKEKEKENKQDTDKRPAKKDLIELHTKVALSEVRRWSNLCEFVVVFCLDTIILYFGIMATVDNKQTPKRRCR